MRNNSSVFETVKGMMFKFSDRLWAAGHTNSFDILGISLIALDRAKIQKQIFRDNESVSFEGSFNDSNPVLFRLTNGLLDKNVLALLMSVVDDLLKIKHEDFLSVYSQVVECLIEKNYKGGNAGEFIQPKELTRLIDELIVSKGIKSLYNPFAGLGSYAIGLKGCTYFAQERNIQVFTLGKLRLDAHCIDMSSYFCGDSIKDWDNHHAECIVSTPPFGLRIQGMGTPDYAGMTYEEFVIDKYLTSDSTYGFFVVPRGFCFRTSGWSFSLRKDICEKNCLEMVINLPSGIFYNTGIATSLIVLNKNKDKNTPALILDAETLFLSKSRKERYLDIDSISSIIESKQSDLLYQVSRELLFDNDCSFDVSTYASQNIYLGEGQKVETLSIFLKPSEGERFDFNGEVVSNVIEGSNFVDNIAYLSNVQNKVYVDQPKYKFTGPHFVINMQGKVYLHKSEDSFYIGSALKNLVFKVNEELIDSEYLAYVLTTNNILQNSYFGAGMARSNPRQLVKLKIVFEPDIKKQRQIVSNIKRKFFESEKKRLGIREVGSDLSHMLRMPKSKIGNQINRLLSSNSISENDRLRVIAIEDNFNYILRVINTVGVDFSSIKLDCHEVSLYKILSDYASALKNMEFSNIYSIHTDIKISEDVMINCDEDMIRVLLDTAYLNAYKHAFSDKGSEDNKVLLGCEAVEFDGRPYACITIANNGIPLNISLEDFIVKGVVVGETGNTGKGGYHIYTIAKKHGGYIYLTSSLEWPFMLEVLLPIDLNNNFNLKIYESKCI